MNNLIKLSVAAFVFGAVSATQSVAGGVTSTVVFEGFPKGTKCSVSATQGRVKIKNRKSIVKVSVKGGSHDATYFCDLPNGQRVATNVLKKAPKGTDFASAVVAPDGSARLYYDQNGSLTKVVLEGKHLRNIKK